MPLKCFIYFIVGLSLFFLPFFCKSQTDDFSIARITSDFPSSLPYTFPPSLLTTDQNELHSALDQPYRYLGSGGQCFAFTSQDNQYVIKFFKTRFYKGGSLFMQSLPLFPEKTRQRKKAKALFKLQRDFNSYFIATQNLAEETGVLYLHLQKTTTLKKKLSLTDKLGITHNIDLDHFEFVIQRRAELAYSHIRRLIEKADFEKAKKAMHSLVDLSLKRCKKGIYDEDAKIERNFGFLEERPLFIDIGRFVKDDSRKNPEVYSHDLRLLARQLRHWIETHYPSLKLEFDESFYASLTEI